MILGGGSHRQIADRLHQDSKWRYYSRMLINQEQTNSISSLASSKKISQSSRSILKCGQIRKVREMVDAQSVSLQSCLPYLNSLSIIIQLTDLSSFIKDEQIELNGRLRSEVEFLYRLWQTIGQESLSKDKWMQVVYAFVDELQNIPNNIKKIFKYREVEVVERLIDSWRQLQNDQMFQKATKQIMFEIEGIIDVQTGTRRKSTETPVSRQCKGIVINEPKVNRTPYKLYGQASASADVTSRLYNSSYLAQRQKIKKQSQIDRQNEQLQSCTFKPEILRKSMHLLNQQSMAVVGYEKTVERLRSAQRQNRERKALQERIPTGENYQKVRAQKFQPPKLLSREKIQPPETLFYIQFDLGRKKIKINVKNGEDSNRAAKNIARTHSLNQQAEKEVACIIKQEVEKHQKGLRQK